MWWGQSKHATPRPWLESGKYQSSRCYFRFACLCILRKNKKKYLNVRKAKLSKRRSIKNVERKQKFESVSSVRRKQRTLGVAGTRGFVHPSAFRSLSAGTKGSIFSTRVPTRIVFRNEICKRSKTPLFCSCLGDRDGPGRVRKWFHC